MALMFWGKPCQLSRTKSGVYISFIYSYPSCSHFLYLPVVPLSCAERAEGTSHAKEPVCGISRGSGVFERCWESPRAARLPEEGTDLYFFIASLQFVVFCYGLVEVLEPHSGEFLWQYSPLFCSRMHPFTKLTPLVNDVLGSSFMENTSCQL